MSFQLNDRVVYHGPFPSLNNRAGVITNPSYRGLVVVRFDNDPRGRVIRLDHLILEGEANVKNFKILVKEAYATLIKPLDAESAKEQAVRKLGIAAETARLAEADKKKAKTELASLGVIGTAYKPGTELIFDSDRYQVYAKTSEASSYLDASLLEAAMAAEKLSAAMRRRILEAASKAKKAATSFQVEAK